MTTNAQPKRHMTRRLTLFVASVATLAVALAVTLGIVMAATAPLTRQPGKAQSSSLIPVKGQKGHATCGEPNNAACPTAPVDWTPVASMSASDILAALQATPAFQNPAQVANAPAGSTYSYDTPVLVLPATSSNRGDDWNLPHYIIRASVNGVRMVTYDVVYNPATQELRPISVGHMAPNDPGYGKPFPWAGVSSAAAVSTLRNAKGLALAASTAPQLVFFAPGPQFYNPNTLQNWKGGGYDPAVPIWRLHGADGQLYFVGIDGVVYTPKQLPVAQGAAFVQA